MTAYNHIEARVAYDANSEQIDADREEIVKQIERQVTFSLIGFELNPEAMKTASIIPALSGSTPYMIELSISRLESLTELNQAIKDRTEHQIAE